MAESSNSFPAGLIADWIVSDPAVLHGQPCIRGARISVANVVGQIAFGRSVEAIISDYPQLTESGIRAALAFAARLASGEMFDLRAS